MAVPLKCLSIRHRLMEKPLAVSAGLGWQGKHSNVVSRDYGSWLFLGAVMTTVAFDADEQGVDCCGRCRACLDICPTDAFPSPYQLDARLCISYLTIEHKGVIERSLRAKMGNRIYGCDDCLAVCPWNKFAQSARHWQQQAFADVSLAFLVGLDDAAFRAFFRKTTVKRIGRARFVRNVLIAIGNSQDRQRYEALVLKRLADESALVRGMAVWALARLTDKETLVNAYQHYGTKETDASVLAEWQAEMTELKKPSS